jgi:diguanylate cyclase (GGDEF)-like protein
VQIGGVGVDRDEKLAQVLVEFADTLGAEFAIQPILDHLVEQIVDVLPITGAGVMLMTDDDLHFVAASNDVVRRIEVLQNELQEGPCLEAYRTGDPVGIEDLSTDTRFPRFSPRALAEGLAAVFTFPIRLDRHRLGALDLYRDSPGGLAPEDVKAAQVLANIAAAYLFNAQARSEAEVRVEQLTHRSLHDPLTGLPNRALLHELLQRAVARSRRSRRMLAVLFVDLDGFKLVNDQYGHHVGDQLLVAVADRLGEVLRSGDTLTRLAGDEFVILCEDLATSSGAELVAMRIAAAFETPFHLDSHTVVMTASVGLAFSGPGEDIPDTLLRDADLAMYQAKLSGGAHHEVIDQTARVAGDLRKHLERDLRGALTSEELQLAYQPVIAAASGEMLGLEAFLRWEHPDRGWVSPGAILPVAERTGMILPIGEWVLGQACRQLKGWQRMYGPAIGHVSVNVSGHQVVGPAFAETVASVLAETGTDPASVFLEVTESAFFEDAARTVAVLREVKQLGVGLTMDDFGTGYSSLNYLRRFPFDMVKIDRSFIVDLTKDSATRSIVAAIIDLAHVLDLTVVAEGVETQAQLDRVIDLGIDRAQGYYISPPMLPDQLERQILAPAGGSAIHLPARNGSDARLI